MLQRLTKVRSCVRLCLFESREEPRELALPRGWPHILPHLVVEDDQPRRIALVPDREIKKRRRNKSRIVHLLRRPGRVLHRVAGVEQDYNLAVRLSAIALQIATLCARKQIPVHMAQVVTWNVGAILGELLAEAEVRRSMQASHKAVHHCLCQQVQRGDAGQHRGIKEALHQFSFGRGTCANSRLRISSASIRSDSAWKFSRMRCRNTGSVTDVMSSYVT